MNESFVAGTGVAVGRRGCSALGTQGMPQKQVRRFPRPGASPPGRSRVCRTSPTPQPRRPQPLLLQGFGRQCQACRRTSSSSYTPEFGTVPSELDEASKLVTVSQRTIPADHRENCSHSRETPCRAYDLFLLQSQYSFPELLRHVDLPETNDHLASGTLNLAQ